MSCEDAEIITNLKRQVEPLRAEEEEIDELIAELEEHRDRTWCRPELQKFLYLDHGDVLPRFPPDDTVLAVRTPPTARLRFKPCPLPPIQRRKYPSLPPPPPQQQQQQPPVSSSSSSAALSSSASASSLSSSSSSSSDETSALFAARTTAADAIVVDEEAEAVVATTEDSAAALRGKKRALDSPTQTEGVVPRPGQSLAGHNFSDSKRCQRCHKYPCRYVGYTPHGPKDQTKAASSLPPSESCVVLASAESIDIPPVADSMEDHVPEPQRPLEAKDEDEVVLVEVLDMTTETDEKENKTETLGAESSSGSNKVNEATSKDDDDEKAKKRIRTEDQSSSSDDDVQVLKVIAASDKPPSLPQESALTVDSDSNSTSSSSSSSSGSLSIGATTTVSSSVTVVAATTTASTTTTTSRETAVSFEPVAAMANANEAAGVGARAGGEGVKLPFRAPHGGGKRLTRKMVADAQVAASVREKAAEAAADAAAAPTMCRMLITSDDGKIDAFIINSKVWGELV